MTDNPVATGESAIVGTGNVTVAQKVEKARSFGLLRFSLRTLLVMSAAVGIAFGLGVPWVKKIQERGEAQRAILAKPTSATPKSRNRITVTYVAETNPSWFTRAVRTAVHPEYERRLSEIRVLGSISDDAIAVNISKVFGVDSLACMGNYSESWMLKATSARGMRSLTLGGRITPESGSRQLIETAPPADLESLRVTGLSTVRPEFVQWLCRASKLKSISIDRADPAALPSFATASSVVDVTLRTSHNGAAGINPLEMTPVRLQLPYESQLGEFFDNLASHGQLKSLHLQSVTLDNPELISTFCEKSSIANLKLEQCIVSPDSLKELGKLKQLTSLDLEWTALAEVDLPILAQMTGLREIKNLWCGDEAAEEDLQTALPNCKITKNSLMLQRYGKKRL